jgi:single-strand DNA-binding protein
VNEPLLTLSGNVATDVQWNETENGTSRARFRLATTPRKLDRATGTWQDQETMFFQITCWRWLADNVRDSIRKGEPVTVMGRMHVRRWESNGRLGQDVEINADFVGHDLNRGVTSFHKVTRSRPGVVLTRIGEPVGAEVPTPVELEAAPTGAEAETDADTAHSEVLAAVTQPRETVAA